MSHIRNSKKRRISERFTNAQSEKTILDILLISISCIFFLRGFFDEKHFIDDVFQCQNNSELVKTKAKGKSKFKDQIKIKKLRFGVSKETDAILNWINVSIADALEKKYLKKIDLSIILDEKNPTNIYESYLFNIDYIDSYPESISLNNELILSPGDITKLQIFKLLKKIILLTQSLPTLPVKKFLQMRLLFNDRCSNDYYPDHFIDCSNDKPAIMKVPLPVYEDLMAKCGNVNSVHHNITASLISLSTLANQNYENCKVLKIDPFDLFNSEIIRNSQIIDNTESLNLNTQVSQVTKELYDMLQNFNNENHDGETQVNDLTSNSFAINCTCGSNLYLPYSSLIKCQQCKNSMHKVCYCIKSNSSDFTCMQCLGLLNSTNANDTSILFNIRKLITYLQNSSKNSLNSFSSAALILGFSSTEIEKNESIINRIVDAFSVLIYEGLLSLKSQKSFSHNLFNVNYDGLLINNKRVKKGKYYIAFLPENNEHTVDKLMDPNFGKEQEFSDSLISIPEFTELFDQTLTDDYESKEKSKNIKVCESFESF
jgi:meiosis-specific protein HOP1